MSSKESKAAVDAAKSWARTVAGDDPVRYAVELQAALLRIQGGGAALVRTETPTIVPDEVIVAVRSDEGIELFDPSHPDTTIRDITLADLPAERRQALTKAAQRFAEELKLSPFRPALDPLTLLAWVRLAEGKARESGRTIALLPKVSPEMPVEARVQVFSYLNQARDVISTFGETPAGLSGLDWERMAGSRNPYAGLEAGGQGSSWESIVCGRDSSATLGHFGIELSETSWPSFMWPGRTETSELGTVFARPAESRLGIELAKGYDRLGMMAESHGLSLDQQSLMLVDRGPSRRRAWNSLLASDERWRNNFDRWLELPTPPYPGARMLGAQPDELDEFPYCVAVSESDDFTSQFGSGVLISPNIVLTAGHVIRQDKYEADPKFRQTVWIGAVAGEQGSAVKVKAAKQHPAYSGDKATNLYENDIGLLILEQQVKLPRPVVFATAAEIDAAPALVIVGYGLNENGSYGNRQFGTVFIGSTDPARYGCFPYELVAGAQSVDACHGDSGGGCFILYVDDQDRLNYKLGAVISRSYRGGANCGAGGIKVRVDLKLIEEGMAPGGWASEWLSKNGGILPGAKPNTP